MPEKQTCGFCGKPAENVVEGPSGRYACRDCLLIARDVIVHMHQSYVCSFCGETTPFTSTVEGPHDLHMCESCIESGIKLLGQ